MKTLATIALLVLAAACSKKAAPTTSTSAALTTDGGGRPYGEPCHADGECASRVCWPEKQICTLKCTADADCPAPPTAGKCNKKGFCKKP